MIHKRLGKLLNVLETPGKQVHWQQGYPHIAQLFTNKDGTRFTKHLIV